MRTMKVAIASFDVKAGHYLDDMIHIRVFCFKLKIKIKLTERKNKLWALERTGSHIHGGQNISNLATSYYWTMHWAKLQNFEAKNYMVLSWFADYFSFLFLKVFI